MNTIYFVIGASGSGKTTVLKKIQESLPDRFQYCYFDSIGVPSSEEMIKVYGSPEGWQKANTNKWVKKMKEEYLSEKSAILDGQTRASFIEEACKENDVSSYKVVLFDCADEQRKERLIQRGHPDLANDRMMNWAKFLREESVAKGYTIIDTTNQKVEESIDTLLAILNGTEK